MDVFELYRFGRIGIVFGLQNSESGWYGMPSEHSAPKAEGLANSGEIHVFTGECKFSSSWI